MASWKVTVAGVDKTTSFRQSVGASIAMRLNERSEMKLQAKNGYLPAQYAEIIAYAQDGTTALFGGVILHRTAVMHPQDHRSAVIDLDCVDWWFYADHAEPTSRAYTTTVTLKTVLTDLVADCLTGFGITLDAGQVTGPTFQPFAWNNTTPSEALRQLSTWSSTGTTNYVAAFSPTKALRMFVSGTDAAPFSIADGALHCHGISWEDATAVLSDKVILWCGPPGPINYNQSWTQAAAATSWVADIPAQDWTNQGYVTVGGVVKTVSRVGEGADYEWDETTRTLYLGVATLPANGTLITFIYSAASPFKVTAGSGTIVTVEAAEWALTLAEGQATANGLLVQLNQSLKPARFSDSADIGWLPGQSVSVSVTTPLAMAGAHTITDVDLRINTDRHWRYDFTAIPSKVYPGGSNDDWRRLGVGAGDRGAVPSSVAAPGVILGTVADLVVTDAANGDMLHLGRVGSGAIGLFPGVDLWPDAAGGYLAWLIQSGSVSAGPALIIGDKANGNQPLCVVYTGGVYELRPNTSLGATQLGAPATGHWFDKAYFLHGFYERLRSSAAAGDWTAVAWASGDFTASSSTWGVDVGDQFYRRYTLLGQTMIYRVSVQHTDVGAGNASLSIALPAGYTVASDSVFPHLYTNAGGAATFGFGTATAGDAYIDLFPITGNWTNTTGDDTGLQFTAVIEVTG